MKGLITQVMSADDPQMMPKRDEANALAVARMCASEPVLVEIGPAGSVVPGFTPNTILTSGASLPWDAYTGGQRAGVLGGAVFEGLAKDSREAERLIHSGEIIVRPCSELRCVGSLAGIYTASMPVLIVEDTEHGNRAYCSLFEGKDPQRLNYGVYTERVRRNLLFLQEVAAPVLAEAVERSGGIPLRPIMSRALHMGDELHSRNTAATLLFTQALLSGLLQLPASRARDVEKTVGYLSGGEYFFLRLSMAASKVAADAAHGVTGSSVVTGMVFNCCDFAIRVSGLGDDWWRGPHLKLRDAGFFETYGAEDAEFMGGESTMNEAVGLGGFAQAAAFSLQLYQGGSAQKMIETNLEMYRITLAEHPAYTLPYLGFRGVPVGIDVNRVTETGVTPVCDIGIAGKNGGQIGAGIFRAPIECFETAAARLQDSVEGSSRR